MGKTGSILNGIKPLLVMIVVQTTFAGVDIFYKLAANDGMNLSVLIAYRHIFAAAIMLPLALLVERNKRSKLTWTVACQAFFSGLIGATLAQTMFLRGLALTSATLATATTNFIPSMTFLMAISFRIEKLGWSEVPGRAKVAGTFTCMIGAMLLTFYKGPYIVIQNPNIDLVKSSTQHQFVDVARSSSVRILGALLATGGSLCYAIWLVYQAKINELYPCPYSSVALMNTMASIQSTLFALCTERDWNQWKLGFNIRLLTAAFNGMVGAGLIFTFTAWCVKMRGPVFVSAFNPLTLVLVAVAEFLLLGEKLHLGSFLGSFIIVCGLYLVLWGKGRETKENTNGELQPEKNNNNMNISCET